jgi:peptidoglycan biosynthesis protein MviN/MurJ (putative lipid II flippase)
MAASLVLMNRHLDWWLTSSLVDRSVWLALTIGVGAALYFVALLLFGMRPGALRLRSE